MDTQKIITNHLMNDSDQELMRQVSLGGIVGTRAAIALEHKHNQKIFLTNKISIAIGILTLLIGILSFIYLVINH